MKVVALCFAMLLLTTSVCRADLIENFSIDSGSGGTIPLISPNIFTLTKTGLTADGVTFDATITVEGFNGSGTATNLYSASTGLGVLGSETDLVDSGEYLRFSMAVSNESGGTVSFDGFTEVDYNGFGTGDSGVLSTDSSTLSTDDNFFSTSDGAGNVDISPPTPAIFHAISGTEGSNSFGIDDVTASFTGTVAAVPEPASIGFVGLLFSAGYFFRRRAKVAA